MLLQGRGPPSRWCLRPTGVAGRHDSRRARGRHALVSPALIAAISDTASAVARAAVGGVYRFWRDSGYLVGGLVAGAVDDGDAVSIVAISGLWVVHDLPGDAPARTLVESIAQRSSTGACPSAARRLRAGA
jgi:hypothetical protein